MAKNTMSKSDLIAAVADQTDLSKKDVGAVIDAALSSITEAVADGDDVQLIGFGTFTSQERAAREGRNPATGETMRIEASLSPKFKAGKAFKDAVAESYKGSKKKKKK